MLNRCLFLRRPQWKEPTPCELRILQEVENCTESGPHVSNGKQRTIGLVTPEHFHCVFADGFYLQRADTLEKAFVKNLERFREKAPLPRALPEAARGNKPKQDVEERIRVRFDKIRVSFH